MNKKYLIIICLIFLISVAYAIPIPSPHGFYGSISYSNGTSIENGIILAKINEDLVGSSNIIDGSYDLVVESEYGGLIYFYFKDELIGNYTFEAFEVTELNFVIYVGESEDEKPTPVKDSKSFWQISIDKRFCEPNWRCSGWSECVNGLMMRNCHDTNHCVYSYNKPIEETGCEIISKVFIQEEEPKSWFFTFNIFITFLILIVLSVLIFVRRKYRKA